MFNLSNFDLDIEDDFSSNIFSNVVSSGSKNSVSTEETSEDIPFSNKTTSKRDLSNNKRLREHTNLEKRKSTSNVSDTSLRKEDRENILKRPCVQYEKPQSKRVSGEGLLQRKFPGPAGLLPDKPFEAMSSISVLTETPADGGDKKDIEKPMVYSQSSGSVFEEPSYQKLLSDFNLNDPKNHLNRHTVEWLKRTALGKGLQGRKIPFLGLVVHSVNHTMPDPVVVLRDPTGEIHGSLHREVWSDLGEKLKAGIALALRQVGVLITGVIRRQIYLNITMNNILALYSPSENENQVDVTMVNKISKSELLKSSEQWLLPQPSRNVSNKGSPNSCLFATVNDVNAPSKNKEEIRNVKTNLGNGVEMSKQEQGVKGRRNTEEVLASLGIVFADCDFSDEMGVAEAETRSAEEASEESSRASAQALSQADSLIFEEVLSGINLDEFDM